MIQETYERGRVRLIEASPKNGHSASGFPDSKTARIAGRTRCPGPEPRGYSEEEKEQVSRAYRERGSKRAISRIFGGRSLLL